MKNNTAKTMQTWLFWRANLGIFVNFEIGSRVPLNWYRKKKKKKSLNKSRDQQFTEVYKPDFRRELRLN